MIEIDLTSYLFWSGLRDTQERHPECLIYHVPGTSIIPGIIVYPVDLCMYTCMYTYYTSTRYLQTAGQKTVHGISYEARSKTISLSLLVSGLAAIVVLREFYDTSIYCNTPKTSAYGTFACKERDVRCRYVYAEC